MEGFYKFANTSYLIYMYYSSILQTAENAILHLQKVYNESQKFPMCSWNYFSIQNNTACKIRKCHKYYERLSPSPLFDVE
jgi:hypothetical protein